MRTSGEIEESEITRRAVFASKSFLQESQEIRSSFGFKTTAVL